MTAIVTNKRKILDLSKPILVSTESFAYLKNNKSVSDDGTEWDITLQEFSISRNKSEYPKDDLIKSLRESRTIQEALANKVLFSELEHPPRNSELQRFMHIEPTRWCANIKNYRLEGEFLKGSIKLVPPLGTTILQPIMQSIGSNFAASIRAYTPNFVKKDDGQGGTYFIKKYPMYVVTWDIVMMPGFERARIMDPKQYALSKESLYEREFENPANEIKEMIMAGESANFIEDFYGISLEDAKAFITGKNRIEISEEGGNKISLPLDRYLVSQILK